MSKCKAGEMMTFIEVKYLITGAYYHACTINYAIIINSNWTSCHSGDRLAVECFFHQCESFHALLGRPSGQISCHSGGSWMVFVQFEFSHELSGCISGRLSYNSGGSWMVFHQCNSALFLKWKTDWKE